MIDEGYHLYMVDVETGELIYKRQLDGAAPSAPAAIDSNFDGISDRIFIGTTAGTMYKVDLTEPVALLQILELFLDELFGKLGHDLPHDLLDHILSEP